MLASIRVSIMDTTFSYPFYKYSWISNATCTHTRGYRLVPELVPNKFFTHMHMDNGYPLPRGRASAGGAIAKTRHCVGLGCSM
jgi:hypothetical protein